MLHKTDPEAYLIDDHECTCDLASVRVWEAQESFRKGSRSEPQYLVISHNSVELKQLDHLPESQLVSICLSYHRVMLNDGPNLV